MEILLGPLALLSSINTYLLRIGRFIGWVAIGLMVVVILLQVFCRYILGSALPWPDEAARFLMLWMTGLMAPSAFRWGGFVSIDMLKDMLPRVFMASVNLILLSVSMLVLVVAIQFGLKHVASGWLFASSSLNLPLHWVGGESVRVKLAWMYMSLPIGFAMMALVNVELILKSIHMMIDPEADYAFAPDQDVISAE